MLSLKFNYFKMCIVLIGIVVVVHPRIIDAQSYYFNIGHNPPQFFNFNDFREVKLIETNTTQINTDSESTEVIAEKNLDNQTKLIVYKKTFNEKPEEYSETAMDVITIIWYVAMFLALAAFFMLMACSERRRSDAQRQRTRNTENNETSIPPPTPSPSYSEFAPPSYDTVIKMQQNAKTSIFVIPFNNMEAGQTQNNRENTSTTSSGPVKFYTVNELQNLHS